MSRPVVHAPLATSAKRFRVYKLILVANGTPIEHGLQPGFRKYARKPQFEAFVTGRHQAKAQIMVDWPPLVVQKCFGRKRSRRAEGVGSPSGPAWIGTKARPGTVATKARDAPGTPGTARTPRPLARSATPRLPAESHVSGRVQGP